MRLITVLLTALNDVSVQESEIRETFDDTRQRWWDVARPIHRQGHHQGVRVHVLDWPAFLREAYCADHPTQLLRIVYRREWAAAKTKHAGKLVNAQKTMELGETIELVLELADGSPSLSLAEIKKAIKDLKDAAAKNLKRKRGPKNNIPGRGQEGEGEEEEQGREDEPEAPHAAKRVRVDQDLRKSLADDYIYRLLDAGPSFLDDFGFGPDVSAAPLVAPPDCRGAQLVAACQDTEAELKALLLSQHRQDELVCKQLELLSCL
ncbi:hypothetical protein LY76DRAFT_688226 [Colletotrichum caudatum]|nr:hypothetical protein LY76DRAFT_688226 [Colletotrichum caudatum]